MNDVLIFLRTLYDHGLGYSAIHNARCALSAVGTVENFSVGKHPLVCRFLAGVENSRPPLPRYNSTWDLDIVLTHLEEKEPLRSLRLLDLTMKLAMLLSLVTGKRGQNLHLLDTKHMVRTGDVFTFMLQKPVKNFRKGRDKNLQKVTVRPFRENSKICPVTVLKEYMRRTAHVRTTSMLFVKSYKPFSRVTRATISRWVKSCMREAGINTAIFQPHSTRAASVSKAFVHDVPVPDIIKQAGWKGDNAFAKYYLKPIENTQFSNTVLRINRKKNRP